MSKKLLAAVLALSLVMSLLFVPAAAATTFDDVAADHWAASSIEKWAGYGVLTGHGDGTFTPDVAMTRAEFAAMLVKMLGLTAKSETKFTDVTDDHWAAEVISIAVKAGIINGVGDNKFDPDIPVSFEEAAVMMCRAFGLAKNTSGTDWSKESIEKLTSLGMIGEGADEHLQVGVECNRAVVAKLADTMVAEYVAEDRATPITGEVKGVVLVVKGAKAEIKDATLAAPVVAESASVTLTNTKADAVIVSGKDAAVTADEQSTVASVVLAGEAPKADIKGEVASVTVAEETTGAVIEAPKAADNAIVNNSGTDITVNGEIVNNKTDDEPSTPTDTANSGTTITSNHKHTWTYVKVGAGGANSWKHTKTCDDATTCKFAPVEENCTIVYEHTMDGVTPKHIKKCSLCGNREATAVACDLVNGVCTVCGYRVTIDESANAGNKNIPDDHVHTWVAAAAEHEKNVAATCTTGGKKAYTCSGTGGEGATAWTCGAIRIDDTEPLGHDFESENATVKQTVAATCVADGYKIVECGREGCTVTKRVTLPMTPDTHTQVEGDAWVTSPTQHWHACKYSTNHKISPANHTWVNGKCSVCEYVRQSETACIKKGEHANLHVGENCDVCGYAGTKKYAPADCPDEASHETMTIGQTCAKCGYQGTVCPNAANHGDIMIDKTCAKCGYQGIKKYAAANCPDSANHENIMIDQDCPKCDFKSTKKYAPAVCPDKDSATHGNTECPKCGYTKPTDPV